MCHHDVDGRCYVYMEICLVFHFHYYNHHQTIHHCSPGHFDDDVVDVIVYYLILMKNWMLEWLCIEQLECEIMREVMCIVI